VPPLGTRIYFNSLQGVDVNSGTGTRSGRNRFWKWRSRHPISTEDDETLTTNWIAMGCANHDQNYPGTGAATDCDCGVVVEGLLHSRPNRSYIPRLLFLAIRSQSAIRPRDDVSAVHDSQDRRLRRCGIHHRHARIVPSGVLPDRERRPPRRRRLNGDTSEFSLWLEIDGPPPGIHAAAGTYDADTTPKTRSRRHAGTVGRGRPRWAGDRRRHVGTSRREYPHRDLGGTTLGLAPATTIWLDDNAAGWAGFVDRTPRSDSEFRRAGNQGRATSMDLLTCWNTRWAIFSGTITAKARHGRETCAGPALGLDGLWYRRHRPRTATATKGYEFP